jgi:hypothetical protein
MDRSKLAQLWWELMQIPVGDFFAGHPERMVAGSSPHGTTMSPGYVGRNYGPGGWLLVGNYPAGGTASYIERPNPTDQRLYGSFASLAAADTAQTRLVQFETMSATWIELQRTHQIYRTLFLPLFRAAAKTDEDVAFLNAFPFRCRDNKAPSIGMYANAWRLAVSRQIDALQPARIIALGVATGRAIERFPRGSGELIVLERSNGDRYLKDSAQKVIAAIAQAQGGAGSSHTQASEHAKDRPNQPEVRSEKTTSATADRDRGGARSVAQRESSAAHLPVSEYRKLFQGIGLKATRGHTLKHSTRNLPSLYFNYKKDEKVFFTAYKRDSHCFPSHLWERLDPQQAKDNQPQLFTVRPKAGQATAAFEDWLGRF